MPESKENLAVGEGAAGGWRSEVWETLRIIIISILIVLPTRYFIAQPFIVRGASMEPNFHDGEYLIVDEVSFDFREPARGESIVFRYPRDPRQFFIKRIVGLPGEKVELRDGRVHIVNSKFPEGFAPEERYLVPPDRSTRPDLTISLGPGEYFVLGDNRDFSSDSRVWGVLGKKFITGRTFFRAWPVQRLGVVPDYSVNY